MNTKTNNNKPPCPKCSSNNSITKAGTRKTKTETKYRYFCKTCKYKFTVSENPISVPLHTSPLDEAILYALRLSSQTTYTYKKVIRLTPYEIADFVNKRFKLNVNHTTISEWLSKFTPDKFLSGVTEDKRSESPIKSLEMPDPDRIFKPYKINTTFAFV